MKTHINNEIKAGEYYISDPCYLLSDDRYYQIMDYKFHDHKYEYEESFSFDGHKLVVFETAYGDGGYDLFSKWQGDSIATIGVDSGHIAIIPVELVDDEKLGNKHIKNLIHKVKLLDCIPDNDEGFMQISDDLSIDTIGD